MSMGVNASSQSRDVLVYICASLLSRMPLLEAAMPIPISCVLIKAMKAEELS